MKKNNGFTLIELIVVIVLLGIIAAVAVPRFVNLSSDARIATNEATAASLGAAINLAHLKWVVLGSPGRVQNLQGVSDGRLDFNTDGWPIGMDKGSANDNIGRGAKGCHEIWNYLIESGPRAARNTSVEYQGFRHTASRQCSFVLRSNGDTSNRINAQLGVRYNSTTGAVTTCGQLVGANC